MSGIRHVPVALATTAAVICAAGWYMSTHASESDFDSCQRSGGQLLLTYSYTPGQGITLSRIPLGNGDVTVSYQVRALHGVHVLSAVMNTLYLDDLGGKVFYPDGREIKCHKIDPDDGSIGPTGQ